MFRGLAYSGARRRYGLNKNSGVQKRKLTQQNVTLWSKLFFPCSSISKLSKENSI